MNYGILFASQKKDVQESLEISMKVGVHQDFIRIVFFVEEDYLKNFSSKKADGVVMVEFKKPVSFNLIGKNLDREDLGIGSIKELMKGLSFEAKRDSCIIKAENLIDLKTMRLSEPSRLVVDIYMGGAKIKKDSNMFRSYNIMVDPGHGGYDKGVHTDNILEKNFVLDFSKNFKDIAERNGKKVFLTRSGDYAMSLTDRIRIINKKKPDFLISFHVMSGDGFIMYVAEKNLKKRYEDSTIDLNKYSEAISKSIADNVRDRLGINIKIEKSKSIIGSYINVPSILIELPNPEKFAYDKKVNLKIINAILDGLSQELNYQ
jgi:N-acetylmuramoyl-L-alanine amidase